MKKLRIIPKLLLKTRQVGNTQRKVLVTTYQFSGITEIGDPVAQARIYESQVADELIFIDLDLRAAADSGSLGVVRRAAEEIFMPFTVGGGVSALADFRALMLNGADKVSVNTAAVINPELITCAAQEYGSQAVVVSIDYRALEGGEQIVYINRGRTKSEWRVVDWAREAERRGAGEILLTCIDRDGTSSGLDIDTIRAVASDLSIPVIASGGCGLARHFVDGFQRANADAVAAGTFFSFKDQNPMQTRAHIANAGVPVRLNK